MKNIFKLTSLVLLTTFLSACTDTDVEPLFDQSVNERTEALKAQYLDVLTAPEFGWIGYYSPNKNSGVYTVLTNFDVDGSVLVHSDYDSGSQNKSITYRLDKTLKIELVFETHAVFHEIFEINNNRNAGEFVFNVLSATDDEVILESKLDYGDDITILTLTRAVEADWNLELNYDSIDNLTGTGTESVFRNILLNNTPIATFHFDPLTRLVTIQYLEDGELKSVSGPILITKTGFNFLFHLEINGTVLTTFTFNETKNEYQNVTDDLLIKYDNIPGIPLDAYDFGVRRNNARFNYLEPGKSSFAFNNLYQQLTGQFTVDTGGFTISRVYFRWLNNGNIPYIEFWILTSTGNFRAWYDLNVEVENGIVIFSLTGDTNAPGFIDVALQPLLDAFVRAPSGYYLKKTGGLPNFSNQTFSMINVDDPTMEINYYDF